MLMRMRQALTRAVVLFATHQSKKRGGSLRSVICESDWGRLLSNVRANVQTRVTCERRPRTPRAVVTVVSLFVVKFIDKE